MRAGLLLCLYVIMWLCGYVSGVKKQGRDETRTSGFVLISNLKERKGWYVSTAVSVIVVVVRWCWCWCWRCEGRRDVEPDKYLSTLEGGRGEIWHAPSGKYSEYQDPPPPSLLLLTYYLSSPWMLPYSPNHHNEHHHHPHRHPHLTKRNW